MTKVIPMFKDRSRINREALSRNLQHTAARMHERAKGALAEAELTGSADANLNAKVRLQLTQTLMSIKSSNS